MRAIRRMYISALFITLKKQPRYLPTSEWEINCNKTRQITEIIVVGMN